MARTVRDSKLESRTARLKLATGKYHWRGVDKGLALGYRRGEKGGTWTVRKQVDYNRYETKSLGNADDHSDADGVTVLDYFQAHTKALAVASHIGGNKTEEEPYTVADAVSDYLRWFAMNRKSLTVTRQVIEAHIIPKLGTLLLNELNAGKLRKWHQSLAEANPRVRGFIKGHRRAREIDSNDPEAVRKRKASANRVLTILKAALNHAWHDGHVVSDDAWRKVKPFRGVNSPKIRYLTEAECKRLINACEKEFRPMVRAALYTGARYGELTGMRVHDYNPDAGTVLARETKNSKPRHIPLTDEGQEFFENLALGRKGSEFMFLRDDGEPWGKSHQARRLERACEAAKISPAVSFHVLRHSYGSALALKGVPLQVIAAALGHSDTRITERHYAHLQPSYVADTIRANLPSFGGVKKGNTVPINKGKAK